MVLCLEFFILDFLEGQWNMVMNMWDNVWDQLVKMFLEKFDVYVRIKGYRGDGSYIKKFWFIRDCKWRGVDGVGEYKLIIEKGGLYEFDLDDWGWFEGGFDKFDIIGLRLVGIYDSNSRSDFSMSFGGHPCRVVLFMVLFLVIECLFST